MFKFIDDILHNCMLANALLAWVVAQVLKTLYTKITTGRFEKSKLVGPGGMPSSHAACMVALTATIARSSEGGATSPAFAVAFIFTCVVMYDAMGVRWHAGEHAKIINKMVELLDVDEDDHYRRNKLKEVLGHRPREVVVGALIGLLIGIVMPATYA